MNAKDKIASEITKTWFSVVDYETAQTLERRALAAEARLVAVERERDDAGSCFVHERAEHSRTADQLRLATERVRALEDGLRQLSEIMTIIQNAKGNTLNPHENK